MDDELKSSIARLAQEAFGEAAVAERIEPLAGDASTRRYARLWLSGSNAPPTAVAMILADRGVAMSSDELAVFKEAPKELPYVNVHQFLAPLGVPTPEIYFDASERGLLLLEDIGDTPLWDAVQGLPEGEAVRWYERAIDELLRLQIEGSRAADSSCIAFQQAFDERLFLWEFEHFIEYGIEKRLQLALPPAEAAILRDAFARLARDLGSARRFLNHRDYHSWNVYVHDGRVRVIDFQDALLAPAPYDLATLLGDRDTPQVVTPSVESHLLRYYHKEWHRRGGEPIARERFEHEYYACAFQKALKVVGRFYFLDMVKGKPGYLRFIPSTVRRVDGLLPRFGGEMAEVVSRYLPRGL